jgi:hypothetical protein
VGAWFVTVLKAALMRKPQDAAQESATRIERAASGLEPGLFKTSDVIAHALKKSLLTS